MGRYDASGASDAEETTGKTTSKTAESTPENNRLFLKNKPTIAITKTKARATAKTIAKAITKESLSSCGADKPRGEKRFLFPGQDGGRFLTRVAMTILS